MLKNILHTISMPTEKATAILLVALLLFAILGFVTISKNTQKEDSVYKLGNLTVCDKYHDKTACSSG